MKLFNWLFRRKRNEQDDPAKVPVKKNQLKTEVQQNAWEDVPAYIDVGGTERELVSVIASSIAAGDYPESKFVIKKVQKINPEARTVSIIATALATGNDPKSKFTIKKIKKRK